MASDLRRPRGSEVKRILKRGKEAIAWLTRWHETNAANAYTSSMLGELHRTYEAARLAARLAKLTAKQAG